MKNLKLKNFDNLKTVYNKIENDINKKKIRVNHIQLSKRSKEDYTYKIAENFELDQIERNLKDRYGEDSTFTNCDISTVREVTIDKDLEMRDNIFHLYSKGMGYKGTRRARGSRNEPAEPRPTELVMIDFTETIPQMLYLYYNKKFIKDEFNNNFTENELNDYSNIMLALMERTISEHEVNRLVQYLLRDEVTEEFYRSVISQMPDEKGEYKHFNLLGTTDILENSTMIIYKKVDLLYYALKSILLPFYIDYLEDICKQSATTIEMKIHIRSISSFRLIIERDLWNTHPLQLVLGPEVTITPKITIIKTIHRTKQEALEGIMATTKPSLDFEKNKHFETSSKLILPKINPITGEAEDNNANENNIISEGKANANIFVNHSLIQYR